MAEEVIWSPRMGETGDDQYHWPEAQRRTDVGATDGYSSTPTLSQVNAGADWNQIIAEVKRRYAELDLTSPPAYLSSARFLASNFSGLRTPIDSIRSYELSSAYSWAATIPAANAPLTEAFFFELRKALSREPGSPQSWAAMWMYAGGARLRYNLDDNDLTKWRGGGVYRSSLGHGGSVHGVSQNSIFVSYSLDENSIRLSKADFSETSLGFKAYTGGGGEGMQTIGGNLYLLGGGLLWRSTDDGDSWTSYSFPSTFGGLALVGPRTLPYLLGSDLIIGVMYGTQVVCFGSSDNGASWSSRGTTGSPNVYGFIPRASGGIWAYPFDYYSYYSTDGGATWSSTTGKSNPYSPFSSYFYASINSVVFTGNYRSTDDGATWSSSGCGPLGFYDNELYARFVNGSYYEIKKTSDGLNWTSIGVTNLPTSQWIGDNWRGTTFMRQGLIR